MRDSVLAVELETFAAVKKTTVAKTNLFQDLHLLELILLADSGDAATKLHTFSVLSSHGCPAMFMADVWRTSSPSSISLCEFMGTGMMITLKLSLGR